MSSSSLAFRDAAFESVLSASSFDIDSVSVASIVVCRSTWSSSGSYLGLFSTGHGIVIIVSSSTGFLVRTDEGALLMSMAESEDRASAEFGPDAFDVVVSVGVSFSLSCSMSNPWSFLSYMVASLVEGSRFLAQAVTMVGDHIVHRIHFARPEGRPDGTENRLDDSQSRRRGCLRCLGSDVISEMVVIIELCYCVDTWLHAFHRSKMLYSVCKPAPAL